MSHPEVPEEARGFLQYVPLVADYIRANRKPSKEELSLLRTFSGDAFERLKTLTYEEILEQSEPFASHPEYGQYVELIRTEQARAWIEDVIARIKTM